MFDDKLSDCGKYAEDYRLTLNKGYKEFLKDYRVKDTSNKLIS